MKDKCRVHEESVVRTWGTQSLQSIRILRIRKLRISEFQEWCLIKEVYAMMSDCRNMICPPAVKTNNGSNAAGDKSGGADAAPAKAGSSSAFRPTRCPARVLIEIQGVYSKLMFLSKL